ncbi:putative membrane protein YdbT with pleckstrin-like domain [Alkalihalobacillus xiaoxiensis]|uniref:Membrane protein YdbT with pleckstrin-like domain n=1 Tax=Shouchella xiaoxiensis TaxID=766895 RepID=A0ABS2SW50_9BACI|nr:putative membrane protein YdbT with pleckstrin-like domain [Shouchella xiaoxiensis]
MTMMTAKWKTQRKLVGDKLKIGRGLIDQRRTD